MSFARHELTGLRPVHQWAAAVVALLATALVPQSVSAQSSSDCLYNDAHVHVVWAPLWQELGPELTRKVSRENSVRVFDQSKRNICAWEARNNAPIR